MVFLDTNYFLRFLLRDVPAQFETARQTLNDGAVHNLRLFTSTIVIFELYWVLSSFYQKQKSEACEIIKNVLQMDFIDFEYQPLLQRAIVLHQKSSFSFEDTFNLLYAKENQATDFKTFDAKLLHAFTTK